MIRPRMSWLCLFVAVLALSMASSIATEAPDVPLAADAGTESDSPDVLEGTLRVHPKFHYRYYIDGFGDGQECALFDADSKLASIKPGTPVRVSGKLASKFFGDRKPNATSALLSTWIIYMSVEEVEVLPK